MKPGHVRTYVASRGEVLALNFVVFVLPCVELTFFGAVHRAQASGAPLERFLHLDFGALE